VVVNPVLPALLVLPAQSVLLAQRGLPVQQAQRALTPPFPVLQAHREQPDRRELPVPLVLLVLPVLRVPRVCGRR
jgi:hypothetical protein